MDNISINDEYNNDNHKDVIYKDIKDKKIKNDSKKHKDKKIKNNSKKHKHKDNKEQIEFKVSPVSISTCTVLTNLNSKLNLGLISRFIPIHDQYSKELDDKNGGIYNLEFYGNCARGETLIDKIKDEFNNQATIKFKYWGFRCVNVKFFANGKLQMTGLKYENEAKEIAQLLINIINNITISVITSIESLQNNIIVNSISNKNDFQLIYDKNTNNIFYYRKSYDRFLIPYEFDTDIIYNTKCLDNFNIKDKTVNFNRKNYVKEIHDSYNDTIESKSTSFLKENEWYDDNTIKTIITKIEHIKYYFTFELEQSLINSYTLIDIKKNIEGIIKKYTDFKFTPLDKILGNIHKNLYNDDEQTISNLKNEIFKFNKQYINLLEKKINRLVNIRTIDISICNFVKNYLIEEGKIEEEKIVEGKVEKQKVENNIITIPLEKLELNNTIITEPHNYNITETQTVLINSDLSINHNIDLKRISKILKREGLFNTYEPDDYPGVLTKYYYNDNNNIQGICNCPIHCSTREKHSICTKITISVFRPGSIIITGARKLIHLMSAHDKILEVLKTNIEYVKGIDNEDDNKQIAILNNEFRKISKKPRLFFIKKEQIVN